MKNKIEEIKEFISNDNLEEALMGLKLLVQNKKEANELTQHMARLYNLNTQLRKGIISNVQADLSKNQIRSSIIEFLSQVEKYDNENTPLSIKHQAKYGLKKYTKYVIAVILFIILLLAIIFSNQEDTIGIKGDGNKDNEVIIQK